MKLEIFSKKKKSRTSTITFDQTYDMYVCLLSIFLDYIFNKRRSTNITSYRI